MIPAPNRFSTLRGRLRREISSQLDLRMIHESLWSIPTRPDRIPDMPYLRAALREACFRAWLGIARGNPETAPESTGQEGALL